jgi:hypothetical protein
MSHITLHIGTKMIIVHMPKVTHLDHPTSLLLQYPTKLRLVAWAHGQIEKTTVKRMQEKHVD